MQRLTRPNSDPLPVLPELPWELRTVGSVARSGTGWQPVPSPRALGAADAAPAALAFGGADVSVRVAAAWVPEAAVLAPLAGLARAAGGAARALVVAVWVPAVLRPAEAVIAAGRRVSAQAAQTPTGLQLH
jgi:hypothetical protein